MGAIFVCQDIEYAINFIVQTYVQKAPHRVFTATNDKNELTVSGDFSIYNARQIIESAYITNDQTQHIIAAAKGYTREAQNALLKVLEETPKSVMIYLIAPRKSVFLPTIRSRLAISFIEKARVVPAPLINFTRLDLKSIYDFVKNSSKIDRDRARVLIEECFSDFCTLKASVTQKSAFLQAVTRGIKLLGTNSAPINAILPILLILLEIKNGGKIRA
ncbi:DNA polymerase III subunit delta' [Campylobacterota bacterium]|nr:DNA polymerase III subunit delta' [Campylobacterota bacterium]